MAASLPACDVSSSLDTGACPQPRAGLFLCSVSSPPRCSQPLSPSQLLSLPVAWAHASSSVFSMTREGLHPCTGSSGFPRGLLCPPYVTVKHRRAPLVPSPSAVPDPGRWLGGASSRIPVIGERWVLEQVVCTWKDPGKPHPQPVQFRGTQAEGVAGAPWPQRLPVG